jgi:hypothetical protein
MKKSIFLSFSGLFLTFGLCLAPSKPADLTPTTATTTTTTALNPDLPPVEQAQMLLRRVMLTGKVSSELPYMDVEFSKRVGQKCSITRDQLRMYLERNHISEWEIGGNIDLPVSSVADGGGGRTYAKYMVIHDTSYPRYESNFPNNINDDTWEWNRLNRWVGNVTHIFVNRIGDSKTITPFNEGMIGTKLERFVMGEAAAKGLYLHIELIQPRKSVKGYGRHNDAGSPDIGFTDAQYQRLALLYTTAAVRKGEYLIPGFHACIDSGIKYAHDDPQNFDLPKFFGYLNAIWTDLDNTKIPTQPVRVGSRE